MFESIKTQTKLDSSLNRYLIINSEVLDSITTSRVSAKDDLVLGQIEEGSFSVLKDGKHIAKHLDELTSEHRYSIVLYSNRKEWQITRTLAEFDEVCKGEGLKGFPKISVLVVKDRHSYPQVKARELKVAESCSPERLVAGYSLQSQHEIEILKGISKLINLDKSAQNRYVILENRSFFIEKAQQEGWNVRDAGSDSLKKILWDLCQKATDSKIQDHEDLLQNSENEVANGKLNENTGGYGIIPFLKAAEEVSLDNKIQFQQKQQSSVPGTEEEEKIEDASNQQPSQKETKKTIKEAEKPVISDIEFEPLHKPSPGGSSFTRWFTDKENKTEWIGKCSVDAVQYLDEYGEYKEYLASQLYELLGVKVPKTILSKQYLDEKIQEDEFWGNCRGINQPRLHIFSQVVPGFELLGKTFVQDYKNSSSKNKKELFCIGEGKIPLRGFGRVMAVAILTQDYSFIGNSGRDIGYIPVENGKYFEILKIDPGEALTLEHHISGAPILQNPPKNREAVVGTQGGRIHYNELNDIDQKEFVQTLKKILEVKFAKLEEIFSPFFGLNSNFRIAFEEFLNRRQQLLYAFVNEVRNLITLQIMKIEKQQAEEHARDWGKPPKLLSTEIEEKAELIRNKAQLEAFIVAEDSNSKDSKQFQVSQNKEVFIGRESELSHLKKLFTGNNGILGCAIVGGPGLGKSQLATEYIIRNQKEMYSETVWLHSELSDLIVDQIQIYLETCHKVKFDPQDENKKATIVQSLYQIIGKEDYGTNPNKKRKKVCIVFDNADSMAQIADYLPDKRRFPKLQIDIIITSRYKKWENPVDLIIELQAFGIEDVKNYINACIPNIVTNQNVHQLAKDLNDLIGGLPLALSLAVAYTQQKGMSISEFCEIISKENNKEFISLKDPEKELKLAKEENEAKRIHALSTLFTLALADLRRKYYQVEPILDIIAYLSPDDISTNLLAECWSYCQSKASPVDPQSKKLAQHPPENISNQIMHDCNGDHTALREDFNKALELLSSYSLVTLNSAHNQFTSEDENESSESISGMKISIHRLTQQVIRLNHRSSSHYEKNYNNVFEWVVSKLDFDEKDLKDVRKAGLLVPHAIHLESLQNTMDDRKMAELQERIGRNQLYGVGKYDNALKYYEKALTIKENYYGRDHPETSATLGNLGNAWGELGDYEKKKDLLTRALEIQEKYYGKDHPQTAITLGNLGNAWGALGDYEKQKDLLIRAYAVQQKHYGNAHPSTGITLGSLGNAWGSLGEYEKQKDLLIRAFAIQQKHYGKNHPSTGATLGNLGDAFCNLGISQQAQELLFQSLRINKAFYGDNHSSSYPILTDIGRTFLSLQDLTQGKNYLLSALRIIESSFGINHVNARLTLTSLGDLYFQKKEFERALEYETRAQKICQKHFGEDHKHTIDLANKIKRIKERILSNEIQTQK